MSKLRFRISMSPDGFVAGLVDEMDIDLGPFLFGNGARLFDCVGDLRGLELARSLAPPKVVHLEFARP